MTPEHNRFDEISDYYEKKFQRYRPLLHLESEIRFYQSIINEVRINPDKTEEVKKHVIDNFTPRLTRMEADLEILRSKVEVALE
jgi:capsule polysaccharide export protein KpsE/RkpR